MVYFVVLAWRLRGCIAFVVCLCLTPLRLYGTCYVSCYLIRPDAPEAIWLVLFCSLPNASEAIWLIVCFRVTH